jgi:hypothetical protein
LLVGWSLGVLTTLGLMTAAGGWYEYRLLSSAPGSGLPARRIGGPDSACQVDRVGAINVGGFEVVPGQSDACYLRRPRIRPWQWADGIKEQLGRFDVTALNSRRADETQGVSVVRIVSSARALLLAHGSGADAVMTSASETILRSGDDAGHWQPVRSPRHRRSVSPLT